MKKGLIYEGKVDRVKFPNKGVLSKIRLVTEIEGGQYEPEEGQDGWDEEMVVVKNTLPGQRVSFVVSRIRHNAAEGRLIKVLEKSPVELEYPACPHYGACGGCSYQTLPYDEQLALKSCQVLELLEGVVPEEEDLFEGIRKSPQQFAYRNKMEFTFGDECKGGPLTLGMHRKGSRYDIVPVPHCRIVDEDYRKIVAATQDYFRAEQTPYYHRISHEGYLRHLLVRKAANTGEILVDLVTTSQKEFLFDGWCERLLALPLEGRIAGILHTTNDSLGDVVLDEGTQILYGQDFFYESLLGLKFRITPFSFFQTNSQGAEVLYETARTFILDSLRQDGKDPMGQTLFDLYSGTGTIAQMLAPVFGRVVGVEIVPEAVGAARKNAAENGLANCEFIAGDVLKVVDELYQKPDFIVLDPPREGVHPKALKKIIGYGAEKMLYISCKPTSLQRDLAVLRESGYRVKRMCCVDLFPGTVHVETVVLLAGDKYRPR